MRFKTLILFLLTFSLLSHAQPDEEKDYQREITGGLNFNTHGGLLGGISGKIAFRVKPRTFNVITLDILHIKHQKEQRFQSTTGNAFIPGKINYLFAIRPQFGKEFILFDKAPEEGVQLSAVISAGPTIGILKPYYINYDYTDYNDTSSIILQDVRTEAYDPDVHIDETRVDGAAGPLVGLGESKIVFGLNFKLGLNFEFGRSNRFINGVEVGYSYEIYTKRIRFYDINNNPYGFSMGYINLYVGGRR